MGIVARILITIGLPVLVLSCPPAQVQRYDLGLRMRQFEMEFEQADAGKRLRTTPHLQRAVTSFFALRLAAVAQCLDQARFAMRDDEAETIERWFAALSIRPRRALVDCSNKIEIEVFQAYDPELPAPVGAQLLLHLTGTGPTMSPRLRVDLDQLPRSVVFDGPFAEGDWQVQGQVECPTAASPIGTQTISCVQRLDARLEVVS